MVEETVEIFDAIIVGAGLAGLAAAYTLAAEGLEVLVLERGDYPGAKNVTGGRIYLNPVREMFPELWKKAPLERYIAHEEVCIMDKERSINVRYDGMELGMEPYQSYSVLRGKFDKWFAKQAERKGAMIVAKSRVDDVIMENGQVVGVIAGGEELRANVVIACDGVLSFTAEKAGLRKGAQAKNFAVGFKEIIELPRQVIEDRFNLEGDEGLARLYMGDVTKGKFGGGFLYTNKESISLGIVVGIKDLMEEEPRIEAPQLLDDFKQRPEVARLLKGGETVEYSAHVIPEGGYKVMDKLYGDGILVAGDAAGFSMNIGVTVRGMEYAMASGYFAAQAVIQAKEKNDFTRAGLATYETLLKNSFVLKDFINFKESLEVLEYPPLFKHYPELAGNIMKDLYEVPAGPKARLYPTIKKYISMGEMWAMVQVGRRMMKI
ncbi:MAG: electron transfer flavoprotein [Firmicutes bacterium HGW-Firmicutes-15]|nr:MAG: electron transfer flavoprotein [Firmicutes bacterium HGW-Firmicutes-15]